LGEGRIPPHPYSVVFARLDRAIQCSALFGIIFWWLGGLDAPLSRGMTS
jgi:hypothetical protein